MRRRIFLSLWIILTLFPLAWIGHFSSSFREVYNALFGAEWVHWVMHAGLYAGLAILIISTFNKQASKKDLIIVLSAALGLGLAQEGLQLLTYVEILEWNSLLDLGVDLLGALIGFSVFFFYKRSKRTYRPLM